MTDIEGIIPKEHLLREIEKVMDYEWIYERMEPYYHMDTGRPGTDPVVLIKMVLIHPSREQRELRELTRYRKSLTKEDRYYIMTTIFEDVCCKGRGDFEIPSDI